MRYDELVYRINTNAKKVRLGALFVKMFMILLIVVCGFVLITVPNLFEYGCKFETSVSALVNRTVKVEVKSEEGEWEGSGVFVRDDLILTAGHIVDGAASIVITIPDGNQYNAVSWYKEDVADLGFIEVKTPRKEMAATFRKAKVGEPVWVIGNSLGVYPVVNRGVVSAVGVPNANSNQKKMIIINVTANPGNSGGPAYSEFGTILGICSWKYSCSQGMPYFERAEVCRLSLEKYLAIKALNEEK